MPKITITTFSKEGDQISKVIANYTQDNNYTRISFPPNNNDESPPDSIVPNSRIPKKGEKLARRANDYTHEVYSR